ncbi:MAG: hypothetical protein FWE30_08725 [Bacteroidales bacterium]|nr:hypothetical protein [Bacteroidales bacterium]
METLKKINLKSLSMKLSDRELKSIVAGNRDCDDCDSDDDGGAWGHCLTSAGKQGWCKSNEDCERQYGGGLCEFMA